MGEKGTKADVITSVLLEGCVVNTLANISELGFTTNEQDILRVRKAIELCLECDTEYLRGWADNSLLSYLQSGSGTSSYEQYNYHTSIALSTGDNSSYDPRYLEEMKHPVASYTPDRIARVDNEGVRISSVVVPGHKVILDLFPYKTPQWTLHWGNTYLLHERLVQAAYYQLKVEKPTPEHMDIFKDIVLKSQILTSEEYQLLVPQQI